MAAAGQAWCRGQGRPPAQVIDQLERRGVCPECYAVVAYSKRRRLTMRHLELPASLKTWKVRRRWERELVGEFELKRASEAIPCGGQGAPVLA